MAPHGHGERPEGSPKVKVTRDGLKRLVRLFSFVAPQKVPFAGALVLLFLTSSLNLVYPWLMGDLVNAAHTDLVDTINSIAVGLLVIFFVTSVLAYARIYLFAVTTQRTLALLRQTAYDHLVTLPMTFFGERRVGELNSRLAADISLLQESFTITVAEFLRQSIVIVGGVVLLAIISLKLTLLMLAVVPPVVLASVFFGRYIRRFSREAQSKVAESTTILEETLQGIATVKAFVNERFERGRYKVATDEVVDVSLRGAKWRGLFIASTMFAMMGSMVAVIWYGVYLVNQSSGLTVGDLVKFILYSVFVAGAIGGIATLYSQIQKAIGATEHLMAILDEVPESVLDDTPVETPCCTGAVRLEDVSFAYPSRGELPVLDGVSFEIGTGEQVAIVGPSGAGKSTIAALLMRFYEPTEGRILVDGRDARSYDLRALRKVMAIVPQDVLLFGGTIRENIAYGKPDASEEEIVDAARMANAMEFVDAFPEGLDTVVGERGVQLSGGQRQRIAIARAILKDPALLILDEATSSLDAESERLVQSALDALMEGRTSLVIAHRLSTIRNAHRIVVLDKGRVVETGSHDELVARTDGLYRSLITLQVVGMS